MPNSLVYFHACMKISFHNKVGVESIKGKMSESTKMVWTFGVKTDRLPVRQVYECMKWRKFIVGERKKTW